MDYVFRFQRAELDQAAHHQKAAVAAARIFFGADQGHGVPAREFHQLFEPLAKPRVAQAFLHVEPLAAAVGHAAQAVAHPDVAEAGFRERPGEGPVVVLGVVAREGSGAHVGHDLHPVCAQELDKAFQRQVGVAKGIKHFLIKITQQAFQRALGLGQTER